MAIVACSVLLAIFGCNSQTPTTETQKKQRATDRSRRAQRADDLLDSVWDMLQPDRLGVNSDQLAAMGVLSQWATASEAGPKVSIDDASASLLAKLLSKEEVKRVRAERFAARDALHIRNCIWYRKTVEVAESQAEDGLTRVVDLFYYVIRNIDLADSGALDVPVDPFDTGLFGKGTPESRAWVFANLLRQLRIDAVVLQAQTGPTDKSPPWCVGVLLDKKVYLFDTRLGLPIPSASDDGTTALIRQPATLNEVRADKSLLSKLNIDAKRPYPLNSEALQQPLVKLIGAVSLWAPRMIKLQESLAGERSTVVYDGLADSELGQGLYTRVAEFVAGRWKQSNISVWEYPESQLASLESLEPAQRDRLRALRHSFEAPTPIEDAVELTEVQTREGQKFVGLRVSDPSEAVIELRAAQGQLSIAAEDIASTRDLPKLLFGQPQRKQLRARTLHLLGNYADAIKSYLTMRFWTQFPPMKQGVAIPPHKMAAFLAEIPPDIRQMHLTAAENAMFWMGACNFEQGPEKYSSALETLNGYLKRYADGSWMALATYFRARMYAATDRLDEAIAELSKFNRKFSGDPHFAGFEILIRRWKALADTKRTKASP